MSTGARAGPRSDVLSLAWGDDREGGLFGEVLKELTRRGDVDDDGDLEKRVDSVSVDLDSEKRIGRVGKQLKLAHRVDSGDGVGNEGMPGRRGKDEEEESTELEDRSKGSVPDGDHEQVTEDGVGRLDGFLRVSIGFLQDARPHKRSVSCRLQRACDQ
jgi:hypothetical protein